MRYFILMAVLILPVKVYSFDEPVILKKAFKHYENGNYEKFSEVLFSGSSIKVDEMLVSSIKKMGENSGEFEGYEILAETKVSSRYRIIYFVINHTNKPYFFKVKFYSADGDEYVIGYGMKTDPVKLFPKYYLENKMLTK